MRGGTSFPISLPAFGYAVYRNEMIGAGRAENVQGTTWRAVPMLAEPAVPTGKVWFARTAEGTFASPFYVRHPHFAGTEGPGSIYRLPQGGPCFFDSALAPFGFTEETAAVGYAEGGKVYAWHPPAGVRVKLLDSKDGKPGFRIATEPEMPVDLEEIPQLPMGLGTGDGRLKVVAGGWMFETDALRHAFLDGDATRAAFKSGEEYVFRTRLGGPQLVDGGETARFVFALEGNRVPQKLDVSLKYCSVSARLCP